MLEYGYWGLFVFAFLSASIIPVSSEAAILGAILLHWDPWRVLLWAGIGNCLGIGMNYGIGLFAADKWLVKKKELLDSRAYKLAEKYGVLALFLSWLPVIGDPITIAAGILRLNFVLFVVISFSLRLLRYYVLVAAMN
ncbi:MAG: DedA family protein [Calditrichaeota bacterium]|nr:MAG: DedA family protein [Calditrichota bacterium]